MYFKSKITWRFTQVHEFEIWSANCFISFSVGWYASANFHKELSLSVRLRDILWNHMSLISNS